MTTLSLKNANATDLANQLSDLEHDRLVAFEDTIRTGLNTFILVGTALVTIRNERLYRADYGTFEDYCQIKWSFGRRYANRLIEAFEFKKQLGPMDPKPENERQFRPLEKLPREDRADAWREAVATAPDGKVTAKHVQAVVDRRTGEVIEDAEIVETKTTTRRLTHEDRLRASHAMQFAAMAISQLRRISAKDPLKADALQKVFGWIEDQLVSDHAAAVAQKAAR